MPNLDDSFDSLWLDPAPRPVVPRPPRPAPVVIEEEIIEEEPEPAPVTIKRKVIKKPRPHKPPARENDTTPERERKIPNIPDISVFEKFKDFESMIHMVVKGVRPSLFVTGGSGVGKTDLITKVLNGYGLKESENWVHAKGSSTPAALYRLLFEYRKENDIIVLDDIDKIWSSPESTNILKGALDSYKIRRVSWLSSTNYNPKGKTEDEMNSLMSSGKFPTYLDYSGKLFAISNLPFSKIPDAIRTRCLCMNLCLSQGEMVEYMWAKIDGVMPSIDIEVRKDTLKKLVDHYGNQNKEINFRTLITALEIRSNGIENWLEITSRYG